MRLIRKIFTQYDLLLVCCACIGILVFTWISPITTPPDELAHLAYPRTLLQTGHLPSFHTAYDAWESHQPPAYYLLSVPFYLISQKAPFAIQVEAQRLLSIIIGIGLLFLALKFSRKIFPESQSTRCAALTVLALPSVLYTFSSCTNDAFVILMAGIFAYLYFQERQTMSISKSLVFGILLGVGLLTKYSLYPILLITTVGFFWKKPLRHLCISLAGAVAISGWWFIHNLISVGDILGLKHTFILWQGQKPIWTFAALRTFVTKFLSSFIGVFGKLDILLPSFMYIILGILLLAIFINGIKKKNLTLWYSLACILGTLIFVAIQSMSFFQPQGRYAFAALPSIAMCVGFGILSISKASFKIGLSLGLGGVILAANGLGLLIIHRQYIAHPIAQFQNNRSINLLSMPWIGDQSRTQRTSETLIFALPIHVNTLADLRILSERAPYIIMQVNSQDAECTIGYKRLGDNQFSSDRSFTARVHPGSNTFNFPSMAPTLIQDISLACSSTQHNTNMVISDFRIQTH